MKKNGFTMIELIAVVTILAVIILIALPSVAGIKRNAEEKKYNEFLNNLYIMAENYIVTNEKKFINLNTVNNKTFIQIKDLISEGYIKRDIVNPKTKEIINDDATIIVTRKEDHTFDYLYVEKNYTNFAYIQEALLLQYDGYSAPTNNVWKDISGNEIHATLKNMTDTSWDGSGIILDGIDDALSLGNGLKDLYKSSMTFEIVVNLDTTKDRGIFLGNYPTTNGVNIEKGGTKARFWYNNGTINTYTSNDYLTLGKTITYTFVFDKENNVFNYYQNQIFVGSISDSGMSANVDFVNALIGNDNRGGTTVSLKGKIYAVRIYKKKLTQKEINNNYTLDKVRYPMEKSINDTEYIDNGLLLAYDGKVKPENNVWKDLSGNGVDGVMSGFDSNSWKNDGIILDGIDDHLQLGNNLKHLFKSSMTLEFVLNVDASKPRGVLLGNYTRAGNINIEKSGTKGRIWYNSGAVDTSTNDSYFISNKPIYYTIVFDKDTNTFFLYQNGTLMKSISDEKFAINVDFIDALIGIDYRDNNSEVALKGKMYSVRIYNRILSQEEINKHYQIDKEKYKLGA